MKEMNKKTRKKISSKIFNSSNNKDFDFFYEQFESIQFEAEHDI